MQNNFLFKVYSSGKWNRLFYMFLFVVRFLMIKKQIFTRETLALWSFHIKNINNFAKSIF